MKLVEEDPGLSVKALSMKDESLIINQDLISVDMLRPKPGGQLVELRAKQFQMVLC